MRRTIEVLNELVESDRQTRPRQADHTAVG
jgi:hypothetical protein